MSEKSPQKLPINNDHIELIENTYPSQKTLKIQKNTVFSKIIGELDLNTLELLYNDLSYIVSGAEFTEAFQKGNWDGCRRFFSKHYKRFPTGFLERVIELLEKQGYNVIVEELDYCPIPDEEIPLKYIELRDYQKAAIKTALSCKRGIIKLPTGSGKGIIICALVGKLNLPTIILTHKLDLLKQLKDWLEKYLGVKVGQVGAGEVDLKKINVCTIQTLTSKFLKNKEKDIVDMVKNTKVLITDEVHRSVAKNMYNFAKYCPAYYRFGFSATPYSKDDSSMLLEAVYGRRVIDMSITEMVSKGYLAKPIVYMIKVKIPAATRQMDYYDVYIERIIKNNERNKLIAFLAYNFAKKGKSILIAVTQLVHGETIFKILKLFPKLKCAFLHGEHDINHRRRILDKLSEHKIDVVVATKIFNEGVDAPGLNVIINAKANESPIEVIQLAGRALRTARNKTKAIIIDFYDVGCKYVSRHAKNRLKIYQQENFEIKYVDMKNVFTKGGVENESSF